MAARGIPGFTGATVGIEYGGVYVGGGLAGWSPGTPFNLCLSERDYEVLRQWAETTCDQYQAGIGTTLSANIEFDAVHRGNNTNEPPINLTDENIKITILVGIRTITAIIFIESFRCTGNVKDAARYHLKGKTDGAFTIT